MKLKVGLLIIGLGVLGGLVGDHVAAQEPPLCPSDNGVVTVRIIRPPGIYIDSAFFTVRPLEDNSAHLNWHTRGFYGAEDYDLELWFWDERVDGYRVKEVVPLGAHHIQLNKMYDPDNPPLVYVRAIYADNPCPRRTQWGLMEVGAMARE